MDKLLAVLEALSGNKYEARRMDSLRAGDVIEFRGMDCTVTEAKVIRHDDWTTPTTSWKISFQCPDGSANFICGRGEREVAARAA